MEKPLWGVGRKFLAFALVIAITAALIFAGKIPHVISLEQWGVSVGVLYTAFVGGNAIEKFASRKNDVPADPGA